MLDDPAGGSPLSRVMPCPWCDHEGHSLPCDSCGCDSPQPGILPGV